MISTTLDGGILVVLADNPPVNALGAALRAALHDAIVQSASDPAVEAVVIGCAGRTFFAGADIREFGQPQQEPSLVALIAAIEASEKPVVAAIHGNALGGGLEVAMACHYRLATAPAKLGLPEVKLGLLPGATGTQRLPRLVGIAEACRMAVSGDPVDAPAAARIGLVDRIVEEADPLPGAIAYAREIAGKPFVRTRDRAVTGDAGAIEGYFERNRSKLRGLDAPIAIRRCLEAAMTSPFDEGVALEREGFVRLRDGDQSKALRHYFFAERAAAKIDGLDAAAAALPVQKVGVIGAGTMGGGIAINFLIAGFDVTIVEQDQQRLDAGVALLRDNLAKTARRKGLAADRVDAMMARLSPSLSYAAVADCDLVIEAVFELMDVKKSLFATLDGIVKPGAILASNTSYLDLNEIAAVTGRPESVVGLHFFSPANIMKLLEVVRGARTSDAVLATAMQLARRIGKIGVVSGVCYGFIGNRMLAARQRQAMKLIEEGAKVVEVDRALTDFGLPMGPFQMTDLAGLDIGWDPRTSAGRTIRERLCEAGLRGQKNGRGFYDYDAERNRTPSPEAKEIIRRFAEDHGVAQRSIDANEIVERLLYPMINEAALILEEGIAQRASDIDVVWVNGYGWPAWRGGPMFWAGQVGLVKVVDGLRRHAASLGPDFRLSDRLVQAAESGVALS
ncbi:3-hydroxyacyl-CoA dehydrogenase NAD-binding domain-containing protein [Rhizorhabdus sp. FW153]|uniref:3-hydroxyacyl-CoA dehydrogenase NAD-binding domain-containing protein n=1 Tax=Rhizorhabdus sp. FW153 TaxID=3400216 RepID=UPI003CE8CAD8